MRHNQEAYRDKKYFKILNRCSSLLMYLCGMARRFFGRQKTDKLDNRLSISLVRSKPKLVAQDTHGMKQKKEQKARHQ